MRKVMVANVVFGILGLTGFASFPLSLAIAHEEHELECNETNINAMNVDIQALTDGEAKTTARTEMEMAKETMAKSDKKACKTHMRKAREALEK